MITEASLFIHSRVLLGAPYVVVFTYVVGLLGMLVAIRDLHTLQKENHGYGGLGKVGFVMSFGGAASLVVGLLLLGVAVLLGLGSEKVLNDEKLWVGFSAIVSVPSLLALVVGLMLLGAASVRARLLPRWCSVLVIMAFPGSAGLLLACLTAPLLRSLSVGIGGMMLGLTWILIGFGLWAARTEPTRQHPRQPS
jgi:hypothetical protein